MRFDTGGSPHIHSSNHTAKIMLTVALAMLPGLLAQIWFFGFGVVLNISMALAAGLAFEAIMLRLRMRPLRPFLSDNTTLVTAMLLGAALPPLAPWWIPVIGMFFAIVLAKQLYGGVGNNVFNPAMVGYVVLLTSFPFEMTQWLPSTSVAAGAPGIGESINAFLTLPGVDAITGASPLDVVKTELGQNLTLGEIVAAEPVIGLIGAPGWEWVNAAYLVGGVWLTLTRLVHWRIPVAMLIGLAAPALIANIIDPDQFPGMGFHLFSGAAMLGAFFIATDPVTASTTPKGALIFGAGIGFLVWLIRTAGGYPDGVAFAVLLMNMAAPLIDRYTTPPPFGATRPRTEDGEP
ncbi:MAG: electron transport complex subunit RsxD [Gammaproteobacteria bacterium]